MTNLLITDYKLFTNLLTAALLITNLLIINGLEKIVLQELYTFYSLLSIHYYYTVILVLLNAF